MPTETNAPDVIMWVGSKFYPTIDSYITEAMNLGCAKRIANLPDDIVPGKSRCFLAHDEGVKGHGVIFGFFTIAGVEVILDDEEKIAKYQQEHAQLDIKPIRWEEAQGEPRRLCGHRVYGGFYLVSENDMDKVLEVAEPLSGKCDIQGSIVILLHKIQYPRLRFRGWRYMEPEFLEGYGWPQKTVPVQRSVKVEHKENTKKKPRNTDQQTLF